MIKKYIGDKAFYRMAMTVALPMMIQNAIMNFVSLLDNIMVGRVGTLEMSGVSVSNQLLFVFNLCIFGAVSGAGIFTAQFYGKYDHKGIRQTFRFKMMICTLLSVIGILLFVFAGDKLIGLYLQGEGSAEDRAATLEFGRQYLMIMCIGLVPFAVTNAYSSTMRETGQTMVPMVSSFVAVAVNMSLNYVLIFGKLGMPVLGVRGAAIATVASRYAELAVNAIWLHCHSKKYEYIKGLYRSIHISKPLFHDICVKGLPLLVNELLWAGGMAILNQCYSVRGLSVVAATNIVGTLWNLFSVCFVSLGSATGIIMGQMLGSGEDVEKIRDTNRKLVAFSVFSCLFFGGIMAAISGLFPKIYNTDDSVRSLATTLICINSVIMPFNAYTNAAYFTIRSGGKTAVTFIFDSCFVWAICVPTAFVLSRFTSLPIIPLYAICQGLEIIKSFIGGIMLHSGKWIRNIVDE